MRLALGVTEELVLEALEHLFTSAGLEVVCRCTTAAEHPRCIRARVPDVALIDTALAGPTGMGELVRSVAGEATAPASCSRAPLRTTWSRRCGGSAQATRPWRCSRTSTVRPRSSTSTRACSVTSTLAIRIKLHSGKILKTTRTVPTNRTVRVMRLSFAVKSVKVKLAK